MTKICELSSKLNRWSAGILSKPCSTPEGYEKAKFCEIHGCRMCEYVKQKKGVKNKYGEFCSDACGDKAKEEAILDKVKSDEERKKEEERNEGLINKIEEKCNSLKIKFQENYPTFYEQIESVDLGKLKRKFIEGKIEAWEFVSGWHTIIEGCSLERTQKDQWKEIYQEKYCVANLAFINNEEERFLFSLAKQRKEQERKKKEIIRELKQEFNFFSPEVELNELPNTYHNYESLKYEELKIIKGNIIEEIRNKREEKKLSALLIKADACTDDELREFIRKLEKFTWEHASKHKKSAYRNQETKVDEVISRLWDRLDDLNKELGLISFRADVCRNFDEWLKEAEDLVLLDDFCREFKESIRNTKDQGLILNQQNQAFQRIIEKFREVTKKQIGEVKLGSESQIIDKAKSFSEIKLAREVVKMSILNREELGSSRKEFKFIEGEVNKLKNLIGSNQEINLSEVNVFIEELKKEISNAKKLAKPQNQEESRPNSSSWLSSHWKEAGVIIVFAFFLVTLLVFFVRKRKRLVLKSN